MRLGKRQFGFTLVETLVSVAIIGILTSIIFTALSSDQQRSAAKRTAETLQVFVQEQQSAAQSGVVVPAFSQRPGGYGVSLSVNAGGGSQAPSRTRYILFADGINGSLAQQQYDEGAPEYLDARTLGAGLQIAELVSDSTLYQRLDVTYLVPSGNVVLRGFDGATFITLLEAATITVKETRVGLCYSIHIQPPFGTVSRRALDTCP